MPDFKQNINNWSPKEGEWQQDSKEYKEKLEEYAITISDLLTKTNEKLIGTFDIESTLLNGSMGYSILSTYNTANPGAIALIRFLKEQKGVQYESSIASIASAEAFDAYKLLNQDTFFKNDIDISSGLYCFMENAKDDTKINYVSDIKENILGKITDEKQKAKMKSLLSGLYLKNYGGTLNKKCSVVFEALYRKFILKEENINMLFFDNDIGYIEGDNKSITNFLNSKLDSTQNDTVGSFLTTLGITITPICAASGHVTFEKEEGKDRNQPRKQAVFLNDLAREVMSKAGLNQNEIDKKMLEAEKICFEEYVKREDKMTNKICKDVRRGIESKDEEIKAHITDLDKKIAEKQTLISAPSTTQPSPLNTTTKNNTIVVKKCKTSGNGLLCFMHAAFGEKINDKYECSDVEITKKTEELKDSIIADVTAKFNGHDDADKKKLIEEYTILINAEIGATSGENEKHILQTSLDTLNDTTATDHDRKETIKNCIDKIKNTFPLIWLSYAANMSKNNIVLISEYNKDGNFHIDEHSVDGSTNDTYIHFDGTGVGHFSRCEKIAYKQKLDAGEINVSDIKLEQVIEEIYAKQRGKIDDMINCSQEELEEYINNIYFDINNHISDLRNSLVTFDDDFVEKIIQKKFLELNKLIDEKKASYQAIVKTFDKNSKQTNTKQHTIPNSKETSSNTTTIISNNAQKTNSLFKEQTKIVNNHFSNKKSNKLYTPVYDVNNYAPPTGEKIMSSSVNNSFKNDQPIDKNISADYSNPYIAKLKELQEKAQKIGIFSRITLAIFSWFSSSSAKKRSAIKKLKTISIKNEDKPSYKNDKEMYDLLKDCLDGAKSFVSDIPTLPLENNVIYNHKKMQATQFDLRDMPATPLGAMQNSLEIYKKEPQYNSHQLSLQQRNSGESNNKIIAS